MPSETTIRLKMDTTTLVACLKGMEAAIRALDLVPHRHAQAKKSLRRTLTKSIAALKKDLVNVNRARRSKSPANERAAIVDQE